MAHLQITPPPLSTGSMADLLCTIMILCKGKSRTGSSFWAYMCIKPSMAKAFHDAREAGNFELEDYGTVLESGEGDDVPSEVKMHMERQFGMNHLYEDELAQAVAEIKARQASGEA